MHLKMRTCSQQRRCGRAQVQRNRCRGSELRRCRRDTISSTCGDHSWRRHCIWCMPIILERGHNGQVETIHGLGHRFRSHRIRQLVTTLHQTLHEATQLVAAAAKSSWRLHPCYECFDAVMTVMPCCKFDFKTIVLSCNVARAAWEGTSCSSRQ
jgi:hypothetical protein